MVRFSDVEDGNLMERPSYPRVPLNHSLPSQSNVTPPIITAHPYRPTAKSVMVPPHVRTSSCLVMDKSIVLSDLFLIDMFVITLAYFRPPAFLLLSLIPIF